jgi:hypothetical protein
MNYLLTAVILLGCLALAAAATLAHIGRSLRSLTIARSSDF